MERILINKEDICLEIDDHVPLIEYRTLNTFNSQKLRIPVNSHTSEFVNYFYPKISRNDWNDWHWQLRNSITNLDELKKIVNLTEDEKIALEDHEKNLPLRITPYFASLIWKKDQNYPLRKTIIPQIYEFIKIFGEDSDPLKENEDSPVPGIIHRYPDRVLFLVTSTCSTYCRYCTRSRIVGDDEQSFNPALWDNAIDYIEKHPEIRDVLISGGDPLTMSDKRLEYLLSQLRKIKHVEIIRIGTKVPVVLPQRITPELVKILKRFHPLYLSIHFIHSEELTPETSHACEMLADAGIPLGSQTVLLKDINDDVETMNNLMHGLLKIRVKPYYLYQCDPIFGSGHFRTSVEKGLEIIKGLRGYTSGYAIPHYVIDAPGGGGKIPILPDYYIRRDENFVYLRSYNGEIYQYPDPV
jgi:lysine 2,3-aminomutase